jgi:type IV pilus assembly protein PilA
VELMVVVTLVGIMATVGFAALSKHIAAQKSIEVTSMVQSIRAAQEQYKAMTGLYLDVSRDGGFYPRNPKGRSAENKVPFFLAADESAPADNARWLQLAPTVAGAVQYGYMTRAGLPGMAFPALQEPIVVMPTATEPWYMIEARGDVDGDETQSYFLATSINNEIYSKLETE